MYQVPAAATPLAKGEGEAGASGSGSGTESGGGAEGGGKGEALGPSSYFWNPLNLTV